MLQSTLKSWPNTRLEHLMQGLIRKASLIKIITQTKAILSIYWNLRLKSCRGHTCKECKGQEIELMNWGVRLMLIASPKAKLIIAHNLNCCCLRKRMMWGTNQTEYLMLARLKIPSFKHWVNQTHPLQIKNRFTWAQTLTTMMATIVTSPPKVYKSNTIQVSTSWWRMWIM